MTAAALQLEYCPTEALELRSDWTDVLGVVGFDRAPAFAHSPAPVAASLTPALKEANRCELWRLEGGPGGLRSGLHRAHLDAGPVIAFRHSEALLFGSVRIEERGYTAAGGTSAADGVRTGAGAGGVPAGAAAARTHATPLERATLAAYGQILELLRESGHVHLIRIWNYLPDINRETHGEERYRQFNAARQRALKAAGYATTGAVPAASALGTPAGQPLSLYFLAARESPTMLENPRQTSAYHYPRKYGTYSPSFSRACVLTDRAGVNLFISGTASIVGHESLHPGDVGAQTREALANIEALVEQANRVVGAPRYSLEQLNLKVYVRRAADLPAVERALALTVTPRAPVIYLKADVCRADLLVEIEATGVA
jgi:chorismate lyase/3-hydroxybenzoate synthase